MSSAGDQTPGAEGAAPAALRLVTTGRLQLLTMGGVVACFLVTIVFAHFQSRSIDRSAHEIADKTMPSVQRLAAIDVALRHAAFDAVHAAVAPPADRPVLLGEAAGARRQLGDALASYRRLQSSPGEASIASPLDDRLAAFDRAMADAAAAAQAGRSPVLPLVGFRDRANAVGFIVSRLIDVNSERGAELALAISAARGRAFAAELVLGGLSVALALLATLFMVSLTRQSAAFFEARAHELQRRAEELERFSSRVAHDVLSPLGTVSLALQLASRNEVLDERARPILSRGLASLGRVQRLVDGLLEFALAGARPSPGACARVPEGLASVVEAVSEDARATGISVAVDPLPSSCPDVACHEGVLASLLSNLVRNALKYMGDSPARRITLRVEPRGDHLRFEVDDTGPGVPPVLAGRIFEPYVRGPETGQPGLGLGLATVKRLAEAHGGEVGVTSAPGNGSRFWFELPVAVASARASHEETRRAPTPEPGQPWPP